MRILLNPSVIGALVSVRIRTSRWWNVAVAFALGVMLGESIFYLYWYYGYGHDDPKGPVRLVLTVVEGGIIAIAVSVAYLLICRKTTASTTR